jgi:hypothetical protein
MVEDMFIQYVTETYYYFLLEYTSSLFHKNAIINPEKVIKNIIIILNFKKIEKSYY